MPYVPCPQEYWRGREGAHYLQVTAKKAEESGLPCGGFSRLLHLLYSPSIFIYNQNQERRTAVEAWALKLMIPPCVIRGGMRCRVWLSSPRGSPVALLSITGQPLTDQVLRTHPQMLSAHPQMLSTHPQMLSTHSQMLSTHPQLLSKSQL